MPAIWFKTLSFCWGQQYDISVITETFGILQKISISRCHFARGPVHAVAHAGLSIGHTVQRSMPLSRGCNAYNTIPVCSAQVPPDGTLAVRGPCWPRSWETSPGNTGKQTEPAFHTAFSISCVPWQHLLFLFQFLGCFRNPLFHFSQSRKHICT